MSVPVPVVILTGFLGAGKTSLLNVLLKQPAMANTAVVMNEFGDISLDHLLIEKSSDDIIELSSGCVCCSVRGELVATLERLIARNESSSGQSTIQSIIVETTGLADPVPVLQAVMAHPQLACQLRLACVVTLVDGMNGLATLQSHPVAARQVALADVLLITKTDMVATTMREQGAITTLSSHLASLNNHAPRHTSRAAFLSDFVAGMARGWRGTPAAMTSPPLHDGHHHHHGASVRSFTLLRHQAIDKAALDLFLELLAVAHGPFLLRMKGLVQVSEHPERPVLLHGVQRIFHPPLVLDQWPDPDHRSRLVFIHDGLDEAFIARLYDGFCNIAQIDMPDRAALSDNPLAIAGFPARRKP